MYSRSHPLTPEPVTGGSVCEIHVRWREGGEGSGTVRDEVDVRKHPCLAVPDSLAREVHCWAHTTALESEPGSENEFPKYSCVHPPPAVPPRSGSALEELVEKQLFQKSDCSLSGRGKLQEGLCAGIGHLHFQLTPAARAQKS